MPAAGQDKYKGLPVINSSGGVIKYSIDSYQAGTRKLPDAAGRLVFEVQYSFAKSTRIGVFTDRDSILYVVDRPDSFLFYIRYNEAYIPAVISPARRSQNTFFGYDFKFWYDSGSSSPYLSLLRSRYNLESVIAGARSDSMKALRLMHWVHAQWAHDGNAIPLKRDALSILEEVEQGKRFRCTEYAIVTAAVLNAVGLRARVLSVFTKDVETSESGASHVLTEVYLDDMKRWAVLDPQHDVMPLLNGMPLNAVELQEMIVRGYSQLEIRSLSATGKAYYTSWIFPYLYYYQVDLDNRTGANTKESYKGKTALRLAPVGAPNPTVFQGKWPLANAVFTYSVKDFYGAP